MHWCRFSWGQSDQSGNQSIRPTILELRYCRVYGCQKNMCVVVVIARRRETAAARAKAIPNQSACHAELVGMSWGLGTGLAAAGVAI